MYNIFIETEVLKAGFIIGVIIVTYIYIVIIFISPNKYDISEWLEGFTAKIKLRLSGSHF